MKKSPIALALLTATLLAACGTETVEVEVTGEVEVDTAIVAIAKPTPDIRIVSFHMIDFTFTAEVTVRNYGDELVEDVAVLIECYGEERMDDYYTYEDQPMKGRVLTASAIVPVMPSDMLPGDFATVSEDLHFEENPNPGIICGYASRGLEVSIVIGAD